MKKMLHLLLHRLVLVGLAILLQLVLLVVVLVKFQNQFIYFYAVSVLISVLVVFYIINGRSNPAYKLAWAIPILLVPVFGGIFYLLFGGVRIGRYQLKKMMKVAENSKEYIPNARTLALEKLREEDIIGYSQSNYITNYAESPLCNHTLSEYLPSGEVKFQRLLEELQKAEHFIFLEYFIIEEGKMWNSVLAILEQKVKEGVDVRVTYDDMGCIRTLPYQYHKVLEQKGIQVAI
ncbi:MAG: PLDc N-terminal domain-containing protein, partial [Angelakisella sp.]